MIPAGGHRDCQVPLQAQKEERKREEEEKKSAAMIVGDDVVTPKFSGGPEEPSGLGPLSNGARLRQKGSDFSISSALIVQHDNKHLAVCVSAHTCCLVQKQVGDSTFRDKANGVWLHFVGCCVCLFVF